MNYHVGRAGQQLGVHPEETIRTKLASGEFRPDDLGWCEGMTNWQPLGELFAGDAATPPPAIPAPSGFSPPPPVPGGAFGHSGLPPAKPANNLVGSILVTLFCCLPLGIPAIVFAAQVDSKYAAGDYDGAARAAATSKTWMWWSLGIGLAGGLAYFGLVAIGAAAGAMDGANGY